MSTKTTNLITLGMLVGIILGLLLGYVAPEFMLATGFLGRLYVNALTIVVIPMIFAGVISGVSSLGEYRKLGRAGNRTFVYLILSTAGAAVIALIVSVIMNPGSGVGMDGLEVPALMQAPHARTVGDLLASLIPDNLIQALVNGYFIGLVLLAIAIGMAISRIGSRGRTIVYFCRELMEAIGKIVHAVQYVAPIGLCSLMGTAVALNRMSSSGSSLGTGGLVSTFILAFAIHAVIVLPLFLKYWGQRKVWSFGRGMTPAFLTAIGTGSSTATLPITYDCAVGRNQVDNRTGSLVLPLGASANMNGTAIYVVTATVFVAQAFGLSMSVWQTILLLVTAVVLSFGSSGMPSGGFFLLVAAFGVAGFPPSAFIGLSLLLAIDWIADRLRAVTNVWSDSIGAAVVAQSIGRGYHEHKEAIIPERPSRDLRGGRPERTGRRDDRFRTGRPERTPVAPASPFAVTGAEIDLEASTPESRREPARADSEQSRPPRPEHSDRGGRGRQRFHEGRDQEGREHGRGEQGRRPDDRGRREGRPRFGDRDRGRGSEGGDRPRHRGQREDRRFRGDRTPHEQPQVTPVESENTLETATPHTGVSEPVRNEELFTSESPKPVESRTGDMFAGTESHGDVTEGSVQGNEEEPPEMEYGRSRFRRVEKSEPSGEPTKESAPPAESEETPETPAEPGSQEPIEFGRSPRKRLKQ
ncbi:hypothetical protein C3F09_04170 [candidate division GN15 bacterium]|uniref:Dicarboxylate/amino acid:cation symporter n=1 Tax=candidate division GN15 bacterium TaxID=2072418 RepID=A0A855X3B5_9BACT|nr:MAG: hypothetical protein C3F09_04170 [candidate division GN15 bacterium]